MTESNLKQSVIKFVSDDSIYFENSYLLFSSILNKKKLKNIHLILFIYRLLIGSICKWQDFCEK